MAPTKPLTVEQMTIIGWLEQSWHKDGKVPSIKQLIKSYPQFDLEESLKSNLFKMALLNRGITIPQEWSNTNVEMPERLSDEQFAAISLVLNFMDKRSQAAKLKSIGVTQTKWQGWMQNNYFREYFLKLSNTNFEGSLNLAHEGLLKAVERGDVTAVKFYLEITGRYTEEAPLIYNVRLVLAQVTESIQRHVKDPVVLQAIASDFRAIVGGTIQAEGEIVNELIGGI